MTVSAKSTTRRRPRITMPKASIATVTVGPASLEYLVHEDLLMHYSPFFRAALKGNFREAEDKTVILRDEDPDVFEIFAFWLYHQRLPSQNDHEEITRVWFSGSQNDHGDKKTRCIIDLYVFCEKYNVLDLKRVLMDEIFAHLQDDQTCLPNGCSVKQAFDNLPDSDALCRFLVDIFAQCADAVVWIDADDSDFPWPFLSRVMARYTYFVHGDRSKEDGLECCDYHGHQDERETQVCKAKQGRSK